MIGLIGLAGALGAVARVVVDSLVRSRTSSDLPRGTLLVNVSGSLLLGMLVGLTSAGRLPTDVGIVLGVGFCGGYTTFSTATLEAVQLAHSRRLTVAAGYAVGTLVACLTAAATGFALGNLL